jgi:hypothetical protein
MPGAGEKRWLLPHERKRVRTPDGDGTLIRYTYWGGDRIRWYLVQLDSGKQKSYSATQWREIYVTKTGRVLFDADIQALADEAERGYDVEAITRAG